MDEPEIFQNNIDENKKYCVPDTSLIRMEDNEDIQYWCKQFKVTPERLDRVVQAIGLNMNDIEEFLLGAEMRRA